MAVFYLTCLLFVFVVLGLVARMTGFGIWRFIKYIKEELLIVLGTSSSESVLPRMMVKLENLGCSKSVCRPEKDQAAAYEWAFVAPEADLFDPGGNRIGRHYAGPHWEATDCSKILRAF